MADELMREQRRVYRLTSMGQKTEPKVIGDKAETSGLATADVQDDKYELNYWIEKYEIPNQLESR